MQILTLLVITITTLSQLIRREGYTTLERAEQGQSVRVVLYHNVTEAILG